MADRRSSLCSWYSQADTPEVVIVPSDLFGLSHVEAAERLEDLGLHYVFDRPIRESMFPSCARAEIFRYKVIGASPHPGQIVSVESEVALSVQESRELLFVDDCSERGYHR